jgi:UDP-glucose 4-epimerase
MRVLITGASGFVGAAVVRAAVAGGHEVAALFRPNGSTERLAALSGQFVPVPVDLSDNRGVIAALARCRPEAIVHTAWWGVANGDRFDANQYEQNIAASSALVTAAGDIGVKHFVGLGSQGEYGAGSEMKEEVLPAPTTLYGASKVAALFLTRQIAAQFGVRHAWLRLFSTYGPGDNGGWLIPMLIAELMAGRRPKTTLGTQKWDYLHVDDVARAILSTTVTPTAEGVFNLGSGTAVPVRRIVERIGELVAPDIELVFGEIPFRPDQVMQMRADISKLHAATGWRPTISMDAGLEQTVAWYKEHRR